MKTAQKTLACSFIALTFLMAACDKKGTKDDTLGPEIVIYSPTNGDAFGFLDTVSLAADIYDESELSTIFVKLINGVDTSVLWPVGDVAFGNITQYSLNEDLVNNVGVADSTDATLLFEATDKHDNYSKTALPIILF